MYTHTHTHTHTHTSNKKSLNPEQVYSIVEKAKKVHQKFV